MISYRTETTMTSLLMSLTVNLSVARYLLQNLFVTKADIIPDVESKILNVHIHGASRQAANLCLIKLFGNLNDAEIKYTDTDLRLVNGIRAILKK